MKLLFLIRETSHKWEQLPSHENSCPITGTNATSQEYSSTLKEQPFQDGTSK